MFRSLISFLLIFATLSNGFTKLWVQAGFEANRDYIAKYLCENRNKPSLHCNGKCYLMKKLKQADSQKQEKNNELNNIFNEVFVPTTNYTFKSPSKVVVKLQTIYILRNYQAPLQGIFRPPLSV